MYQRRVFKEEGFEKMDSLKYYLFKKNIQYAVSFDRNDRIDQHGKKITGDYRATVTYFE